MTPAKVEFPKDRKVTARFTEKEIARLTREAKKRGEPLSSLLRELVVSTIATLEAGLEEGGDR